MADSVTEGIANGVLEIYVAVAGETTRDFFGWEEETIGVASCWFVTSSDVKAYQ